MVLDVMLPDMEGFDVARRLGAERAQVPIVFLTARDATEDKIRGLTTGGDDYVTKPFSLEELVARIRTILRRAGLSEPDSGRLSFEDLELDEDTREVTRAGEPVELTATEYRLLRYLMLNPRRVLTRAQLLDHVWDYDFGGDARVLETYISYLRKKLDAQRARADPHRSRRRLRAAGLRGAEMSLRARLVAGLLVLAAVGLSLLAGVTYAEQRSFLLSASTSRRQTRRPAPRPRVRRPATSPLPGGRDPRRRRRRTAAAPLVSLPPGTYGAARPTGRRIGSAHVVALLRPGGAGAPDAPAQPAGRPAR